MGRCELEVVGWQSWEGGGQKVGRVTIGMEKRV